MTEQEKRENVIKELECCLDRLVQEEYAIAERGIIMCTPQDNIKRMNAIRAAIELLKAQEPRVMALEEISSINGGDIVWVEDRSLDQMAAGIKFQSPSKIWYYVMLIGSKQPQPFSKELYDVDWRCWTSRPDKMTREATPWN